jgi:hypothetical protein
MGKIKDLVIDLQNAEMDIFKRSDEIMYEIVPNIAVPTHRALATAFEYGALSNEAKEYWKIKLQIENEGS